MMKLPSERWLRVVFVATALVFVAVAIYIYAFRFSARLHPDDAVMVLLAEKVLEAKSPIVADWYYGNGDIWLLGPQVFAIIPVAILGVGPATLWISLVLGFVIQCVVFVKTYLSFAGELWIALLAAVATSMAWSIWHVDYVYVQLAYGLVTCFYMLSFAMFASLAEKPADRRWWWFLAGNGLLICVTAVQNPTRALVYLVAPLVVGLVWPWRAFTVRRRLVLAGTAIAGWVLAYVLYGWVLSRLVTFSIPRGHTAFFIGGLSRIKTNLALIEHGLIVMCGGGESSIRAVPGLLLIAGAHALVIREVFASRAFAALRFVSTVVLAQLGAVLVPLIIGSLLTEIESVRYLMPSVLAVLGLAVVISVRTVGKTAKVWGRRLAIGWLAALPVAALVAALDAGPRAPLKYVRPNGEELVKVADALVKRGLTYGFSINVAANLLTLHSHGKAKTCPLHFRHVMLPHRWLADTVCVEAARVPDRFFVVADQADRERASIRATLGPELERFSVGKTYDVFVYRRTPAMSFEWLELPVTDGELAAFPMHLPAKHLQFVRDTKTTVESGDVVATGEEGTLIYGPYLSLPKGRYEVSWIGNAVESGGQVEFRATQGGRKVLATSTVDAKAFPRGRAELVRLSFKLVRPRDGIEFTVASTGGARLALHELVIERK